MQFSEVITALQAGSYAQRASWASTGEYIALLPGIQHIWKVTSLPAVSAGNCLFSVEDMTATDWALYPAAQANPPANDTIDPPAA